MTKTRTILSILLSLAVLFISCEEEDTAKIDFEYVLTGESPTAILQLTNTSDVEGSFKWQFSEGANIESSEEANPQITIDKVGEFTITLVHTVNGNKKTVSRTVEITGVNGIHNYNDIVIGKLLSEEFGNLFSCSTGKVYFTKTVDNQNKDTMDIWIYYEDYVSLQDPTWFALLSTSPSFNSNADNSISSEDFDEIINVNQLSISSDYPEYKADIQKEEMPKVVPFRSSNGKKGFVKIQEANQEYIIIDVKVTKYNIDKI